MKDEHFDKATWLEFVNGIHADKAFGVLGGQVTDVDDEQIVLELEITDAARQPFGLLHGGVSLLLAETAASTHATWNVDLSAIQPVGIEINGSHLRWATEGRIRAVGRVLRRSRRFIVHEVEILRQADDEVLTKARVTNYYRKVRQDE